MDVDQFLKSKGFGLPAKTQPDPKPEQEVQPESESATDKGDRVDVSRYLIEQGFSGGIEKTDRESLTDAVTQ
jgi:hypothetical protein